MTPMDRKFSALVRITAETKVLEPKKATLTDLHRDDMVRVIASTLGLHTAETITSGWIDSLPANFKLSSPPKLPAGYSLEDPIAGRLDNMAPLNPGEGPPMMQLWVERTNPNSNLRERLRFVAAETVSVSRLVVTPRSSLKPAVRVSVLGIEHIMDESLTAATIVVLGPAEDVY
jgi:hypothetical protein